MTPPWRDDFAAPPPFLPLRPWAARLTEPGWPSLNRLNALAEQANLANADGLPLRFGLQEQRCGQRDYEAGILATGTVPTRAENWHDLLNALCWLSFPRTKAALNRVQCAALPPGQLRGRLSDAATLFDESGLILTGPEPELARLLAGHQWRQVFVQHRAAWRDTRAYVVGHAVLEKLLAPWPGITAKCLFVPAKQASEPLAELDTRVAALWQEGAVTRPAELFPVPVLGIPGWWPANEDPDFYADQNVFRPPRH